MAEPICPEDRRPLDPVPRRGLAAIVAGAIVLLLGGASLVQLPVEDCNVHLASQFSGNGERFADRLRDCDGVSATDLRWSLAADVLFAVAYGALGWLALKRTWRGWRLGRLRRLGGVVPWLPVAAAALDVLEGVLTKFGVEHNGRFAFRSDGAAEAVAGTALAKWLLFLLAAMALITSLVGSWFNAARKTQSRVAEVPEEPPPDFAIYCSGGGIRSAAYTLGVLRELEKGNQLREARWLAAVSGGAYTAGAYVTGRMMGQGHDVSLVDIESHLQDGRHRFLSASPGGLPRSLLWAAAMVVLNLALVLLVVTVAAWPVGWLLGSWAFAGTFTDVGSGTTLDDVLTTATYHWRPPLLVAAAGAVLVFVSAAFGRRWAPVAAAGAALLGLGALILVAVVVVPLAVEVPWWVAAGEVEVPVVAGISLGTVTAAAWGFARRPLVKLAPRLGGAALAVLLYFYAVAVAVAAISERGWFHRWWSWAVLALGLALFYLTVDLGWLSIRHMYRDRLRHAFALRRDGTVGRRGASHEPRWTDPRPDGPELLICAAAQRIGRGHNGIPAESFTVSPTAVTFGDVSVPTAAYFGAFPDRMDGDRWISSWQATTGAAFSSAMGRFGYGTTNALLAALNIDLGAWFPNPCRVQEGCVAFPPVRTGYLVKEIFGLYDTNDDYVFVADGGQWDNLGLVELLRRRCKVIVCIDASGDAAGEYTILRQAVAMATTEVDVWVDLGFLDDMNEETTDLAATTVGVTTIRYPGGDDADGLLLFAKAQVAKDLPLTLRQFAAEDGTFPRYSTADQLLSDDQFRALVDLGKASGVRVLEMIGGIYYYRDLAAAAEA